VESGYKPGARSPQGPAGLWQMIATTARNHKVAIRPGYDGRLSPVDSTAAAVRYLKTLHGMFAGNWRLAVMGYNAGEYRVLGAIKRTGKTVRTARADALPGLSPITQAYVRKLHALSCLMEQAHAKGEWAGAQEKPVPRLEAITLPDSVADVASWARSHDQDSARLLRLNPAFNQGRITRADSKPARLLAFAQTDASLEATALATEPVASAMGASGAADLDVAATSSVAAVVDAQPLAIADASAPLAEAPAAAATAAGRRHTVVRGDNLSSIAVRYGIPVGELLTRNQLTVKSILRPGMVLQVDAEAVADAGIR
jgi:membrane-bound lytic murein transglycosylase D